MRVVFFGTPQFAVPTLERLIATPGFEVVACVTQPDRKRGRGSQLLPSPVKQVAIAAGIPVLQPERIKRDEEVLAALEATAADAFVVVAYGQILSQRILDMPRLGCVNVHGSLLPRYRGAAPIQWAIADGETETGNTTMLMDAGMDTGAMLLRQTTPIDPLETSSDLAARLSAQGADLLIETLRGLETGTLTPEPQEDAAATYARLLTKADAQIDWTASAQAIHNRIRAFHPACGAAFRGERLKLLGTVPVQPGLPAPYDPLTEVPLELSDGTPGQIVAIARNLGPLVQTGDGVLLLREVQPSGKKAGSGWDWVNGARVSVGERLEALPD